MRIRNNNPLDLEANAGEELELLIQDGDENAVVPMPVLAAAAS